MTNSWDRLQEGLDERRDRAYEMTADGFWLGDWMPADARAALHQAQLAEEMSEDARAALRQAQLIEEMPAAARAALRYPPFTEDAVDSDVEFGEGEAELDTNVPF